MASALSSSIAHSTAGPALAPSSSSSSSSRFFRPSNVPLMTIMERRGRTAPSVSVVSAIAKSSFADTSASSTSVPPSASAPGPSTLYDVLHVPKTASDADIKSAFRRLALQNHPDVAPLPDKEACTRRFLQIHSAYVTLSDPHTRARYDLQLSLQYSHSFQPAAGKVKTRVSKSGNAVSTTQYRPSPSHCSPRRSHLSPGRGRSWETDQCWC